MNRQFTPRGMAQHFAGLAATAELKLLMVGALIATNTRQHIEDVFGDQDKLQELQPETIEQKDKAGYEYPDAPLIASGELMHSFEDDVRPTSYGIQAQTGTEDPKMFWHEFGEGNLPPRPDVAIGSADASESNIAIFFAGAKAITLGEDLPTNLLKR